MRLTPEEYLEIEIKAEERSEYFDGRMIPRRSVDVRHASLTVNLVTALRPALRAHGYRTFTSDLRVKAGDAYVYPDLSMACGPLVIGPYDTLENPAILAEIYSPETEAFDRGRKFRAYRSIKSLQVYLLLDQDRMHAETIVRSGTLWSFQEFKGESTALEIPLIQAQIPLLSLYEDIQLPPSQPLHPEYHGVAQR